MELGLGFGLRDVADAEVCAAGSRGWTDGAMVMAAVMLNLAGGDCVEDIKQLRSDPGFREMMRRGLEEGLTSSQRRKLRRRFQRGGEQSVPSASALGRYLEAFHDEGQEAQRVPGTAFIPAPGPSLLGLRRLNARLLDQVQQRHPERTATLDVDATLVEVTKQDALYCYKGFRAYQPLNVWWDEQRLVAHTEFRDGNVPAGFQNRRVLEEALDLLPASVQKVRLRTDTAGYESDLLRFCAEGRSKRFGVIDFAIGVDVTPEFKKAVAKVPQGDWQTLRGDAESGQDGETDQQWAEVCFVPNALATKKNGPTYRFLAIREPLRQLNLPGLEQASLPFATIDSEGKQYKLFGVVTNLELPGDELIRWHRKRCGRSEQVHAVMKQDLAGGRLPSGRFGANAAWWWLMVLALNLDAALKQLVLGARWLGRRMKAMRFLLINVPARLDRRSRRVIFRFAHGHPVLGLLAIVRQAIWDLARGSPCS
jgi:hypothetical protein